MKTNKTIENVAAAMYKENNVEQVIKHFRSRSWRKWMKKNNIKLFKQLESIKLKQSKVVSCQCQAVILERNLTFTETELKDRAKSLLCNQIAKGVKLPFSKAQLKLTIDCFTVEELLRCMDNCYFIGNRLINAVSKKAAFNLR